jgi:hypothetical protein
MNWGSDGEAGSCNKTGAQKRMPNKGAQIPVQNKGQKQQFCSYFHTDDLHPRQDPIGLLILQAKDDQKQGSPSQS